MIRIFTDGGCTGNPGPGGWAAVILRGASTPLEISGGEEHTTNNRMELTAVIRSLGEIGRTGEAIELFTDSEYVQKGITEWIPQWEKRGWRTANKKPVKNRDLWIKLREFDNALSITWTWVRGHAGNKWNERCDFLVLKERQNLAWSISQG